MRVKLIVPLQPYEEVVAFVKSFFKPDLHETPQKRQKRDRGEDFIQVETIVIENVYNRSK